jgi:DNA-binding response OmpR family regulator
MPEPEHAILLVEDDEALRRILARHLRRHGYVVNEADSAEEAARVLADGPRPGLVILDINLPGGTGWDLLRSPAMQIGERPPVVVASAVTVSPRHLAEFGVEGYLPKPFPLETLLQTVERLLDGEAPTKEPPHA